jgi:hypothetical protein
MNMRKILTLIEDEEHNRFLTSCKKIVDELNRVCTESKCFELEIYTCGGNSNMLCNNLQSLIFMSKRILLTLDLDDRSEPELIKSAAQRINGSRTKGSSVIRAKVERNNVIKVKINGMDKSINQ